MKLNILIFTLLIKSSFAVYTFSFDLKFPSFSWVPSIPYVPSFSSLPYIRSFSTSVSIPAVKQVPLLPADGTAVSVDLEAIEKRATEYYKNLSRSILEESTLDVPAIVKRHGYPCETHTVTTPDGYILTMHRIPRGRHFSFKKKRTPVYLQHGILASSANWVTSEPEKALGYILADAGYDVWITNNRGNTYSKNHTHLSPDSGEFWNFSWHEIAVYDVPTMIDYILEHTKQKQLFYVGHSQGTTIFYVMCSEKPEYNEKIKAMFSLAPIAYMTDINSPIFQFIAKGQSQIKDLLNKVGVHEFLPHSDVISIAGNVLCRENSILQILCINSLFAIGGYSEKQMNKTLLPFIMKHTPAGASTKQMLHYAQEMVSGEFRKWDYGTPTNIDIYNSQTPPKYQLWKVTAPVYLFYSRGDWLSGERDVSRLYLELPNVKGAFLVADKTFNHMDYMFGIDAPSLVYNDIIYLMKKH